MPEASVRNESGKVQVFYRGTEPVSFEPNAMVPAEFAFVDGSVHPSLLAPTAQRIRPRRAGCCKDTGDEKENQNE